MGASARKRVVVGLSGGVDSAVSALLLQQQGYEVSGLFMKNWEGDDTDDYCSAEEDYQEARRVCEVLEIPLHAVNFSHEYRERVFSLFLAELKAGRTPNPDVLCNKEIKFRAFLDHALRLGADHIATGHYARLRHGAHGVALLKGRDPGKDQSYFLYMLDQDQLAPALFPVGDLPKTEVRRLAAAAGLPNHARKDSTGICFIGERDFQEFLRHYLPTQPGDIQGPDGNVLGQHQGLMYYTLGQRHGLGIGGPGEPWYVADKDLAHNILCVVQGDHHPALYSNGLTANQLHWVSGAPPALPHRCRAKTRYRQSDQDCVIEALGNDAVRVRFDEPQRAVTPGQSVVFYDDEVCLGGGAIVSRESH